MSKYYPLEVYLGKCKNSKITLTIGEIEKILGFELPNTAVCYRQWWENNNRRHTQADAWLNAGWKVETADLQEKYITFGKLSKI
jgi:hypothetical protein